MKIQLASDLHLEFLNRDPNRSHSGTSSQACHFQMERIIAPVPGADVLVLAGDIANGVHGLQLFSYWPSHPKRVPIIYVAGNHEFYGHSMELMRTKMKYAAALNNIHYLENESIVINGVRFLGATLWTDYRLNINCTQRHLMDHAQARLNDHRLIQTASGCRFSADDALAQHEIGRAWLLQELQAPFEGKTVVVTHHGCHPLSVNARFAGDKLNAAFVSNLTELLFKADLWLHGHVHDGVDYKVGRCRVVANPAGYIRQRNVEPEMFEFENKTFDKNLIIEI